MEIFRKAKSQNDECTNDQRVFDALAELSHLENRTSRDDAVRIATAQMIAAALYLEATAGKARADAVVSALFRAQTGVVAL